MPAYFLRVTEKELTFGSLGITADDVCLQMGYPRGSSDASVLVEVEDVLADAGSCLCPRFCYLVVPSLPATFHPGTIITRQLRGSEAYALFIATAGTEYESFVQRWKMRDDILRMFIVDALGSLIAERCADVLERHLQASIDKLLWHRTNRFSPGYCGWNVSEQQELFLLHAGHTCGVVLTDSSLMVPIKSVSGIIGLGRSVSREEYACRLCDYDKCYKRRYSCVS